MVKQFLIFIAVFFLFAHCRKKEKDEVRVHDIKGMVYNNCTDSGLANVTVYLKDGQGLNLNTVSDASGNFIFPAVNIHSNTKYSYNIYIPSKSGDNATTFEYCGFGGASLSFNYNEADMFFKPRVRPSFLFFGFNYGNSNTGNANDSIVIIYYQPVFHKNAPDYPYSLAAKFYGNTSSPISKIGNYPMGLWYLEIKKWKSSVYTFAKDSIYLTWGANKTYTINW